ncbi:MAG TPA: hypothetical protein VF533_12455 [Solirubrobacteraceae bacterium]
MHETPLGLLLLPERLERFAAREHAERLLRAPGVVAADPPAVSYATIGRLPLGFALGVAARQAKRLERALPGAPRAVIVYEPAQAALGLALLARAGERAELWYAERDEDAGRHAQIHEVAEARAALRFAPAGEHLPLIERLEALGIASGRLGSERYPGSGSGG